MPRGFLGMEKAPVSFLGWEEEVLADDELQTGLGKVDCLARVRSWNSQLWMFVAVPAGLTLMAARIYCWILMLP